MSRSVVVTGAGGRIGAVICEAFRADGAEVFGHSHAADGDLTDPAVADALMERAGRVDVLVNAAAVQPVAPLETMTLDAWRHVVDTNLTTTFNCTRAAAARMPAGGSIIHVASIEGTHPASGHAHYATSKAAVIMHARAAALELGRFGIRVNSVSPGLVHRVGIEEEWPEGVARWHAAAPLGHLVQAQDVAAACLFLASPAARAISGHDLVVDCGVSARPTW